MRLPRNSRLTRVLTCVGLLVLLAGVAGCGGDSSTEKVPTAVSIGFTSKILSLDPDVSLDPQGQAVLHLIGGNLYELQGSKPVPALATKASTSSDGLTWTFTLVADAKFSDGSPLTAADVAATLNRSIKDPANVNPIFFEPFKSVTAKGVDQVVVTLKHPYPELPSVLTYAQLAIFPASQIKNKTFFDTPISAGPYEIASTSGGAAELTVNANYVGPAPTIGKISTKTVPDANSQLSQTQSGQLDLAYGLPPNLIPTIASPSKAIIEPRFGMDIMILNISKAPLDDVAVRQAVSKALDRDQLSQSAWSGKVKGQGGVWPSTMPGYDASIPTTPDLAGAKNDLQGTKCAAGCSLTLTFSAEISPQEEQQAVVIQENLKKIGIDVRLNKLDGTSYFDAYGKNDFGAMLLSVFDYGAVPNSILTFAVSPGSTGYAAFPGLEAAITSTIQETGTAQTDALAEVNTSILKNLPWAPLTGTAVVSASSVSPEALSVAPSGFITVARKNGTLR